MSERQIDLAEFEQMMQAAVKKQRMRRQKELYDNFSEETLLWLALAPGWSLPLAEACSFPAATDATIADLFTRLQETEMVQWLRPEEGDDPFCTLQPAVRRKVMARYETDARGLRRIRQTLAEIGQAMSSATATALVPSPAASDWAQLAARAKDAARMAAFFNQEVDRAYQNKDTGRILAWIEIARPLAAWLTEDLETEMDLALERAGRQLELLQRQRLDEQHLVHFLKRPAQLNALDRLLEGPNDLWALHYIGAGGVGKTMLLRYIKARLADPRHLAVARIDFDYLNPDYPSLAPGLLLWSFAQELGPAYLNPHSRSYIASANEKLNQLHRRLRSGRGEYRQEGRITANPIFREALARYVDALRFLDRRLLLILDTCEELAKIRPDGSVPENVEETFRILRALHDGPGILGDEPIGREEGLPEMRVIFAGRRPLASSGHEWRCPSAQTLPARPYLRMHEIRGFQVEEAQRYLQKELAVPPPLIQPVIDRSSPDASRVAEIIWNDPAEAPEADVRRCNPYELRLFADWALDDPPPSPQTIATASTADYVEIRVLDRLRYPPLEAMIPFVALLGHLDRAALDALSDEDEATRSIIWDKLLQQEWTDYHPVPLNEEEDRMVLDVEPGLWRRLLAYYRERDQLEPVRQRAAAYLERLTLEAPMDELDWSDFDAAIRALDTDPERAYAWWRQAETRITGRGHKVAQQLLASLTGADGAAGPRTPDAAEGPESVLRPAVLATYAGVLVHVGALEEAAERYEAIGDQIARLREKADVPSSAVAELSWVAQAGHVATVYRRDDRPDPGQAVAFVRRLAALTTDTLSLQGYGALVAAAEAILERVISIFLTGPAAARPLVEQIGSEITTDWKWAQALFNSQGTDGDGPLVHLARVLADVAERVPSEQKELAQALATYATALAGQALAYFGTSARWRERLEETLDEMVPAEWEWRKWVQELANLNLGAQPVLETYAAVALRWFDRALAAETPDGWANAWLHWQPPQDLGARIRLETVLALRPGGLTASDALAILEPAADGLVWTPELNSDQDRLLSLALQMQLALTLATEMLPQSQTIVERARAAERIAGPPQATAHRRVAPAAVTAALHLAQAGQIKPALELLATVDAKSHDFWTNWHAARTEAIIFRRMRLYGGGAGILTESADPEDQALVWAEDALADNQEGQMPVPPSGLAATLKRAWLHAIWNTANLLRRADAEEAIAWAREWLLPLYTQGTAQSPPDLESAHHFLDLRESYLLALAHGIDSQDLPAVTIDPAIFGAESHPQVESLFRLWLRALALQPADTLSQTQIPKILLARLGRRQAAEIAREEGELLSLRLRSAGVNILEKAVTWARESDDPLQTFLAGTAYALSSAAQGDALMPNLPALVTPPWSAAEVVEGAYRALQEQPQLSWLPPWSTLPAMARIEGMNPLERSPDLWRPWFMRLLIWREYAAEGGSSPLRVFWSYVEGDTVVAPGELADARNSPLTGTEEDEGWGGIIVLVVGLLVLIAAVIGLFAAFRWLAGLLFGPETLGGVSIVAQIGYFCGTLVALVAAGYLGAAIGRRLRALLLGWGVLELTVSGEMAKVSYGLQTTTSTLAGESLLLRLIYRPATLLRTLFPMANLRGTLAPRLEETISLPASAGYDRLAASLPAVYRDQLATLTTAARGRTLPLLLKAHQANHHGPPWEAALLPAEAGLVDPPALRIQRQVSPFEGETPLAYRSLWKQGQPNTVVISQGDARSQRQQARAWAPAAEKATVRVEASRGAPAFPEQLPDDVGPETIHLVGDVREDPDLRFYPAESEDPRLALKQSEMMEVAVESGGTTARVLVRNNPNGTLWLLQGRPRVLLEEKRSNAERAEAVRARIFAAQLAARVPAVIVLPPLEPALSVEVVQPIVDLVGRAAQQKPGLQELFAATTDAQRRIYRYYVEKNPMAAWERALDVCVFAIKGWQFGLVLERGSLAKQDWPG